MFESKHSAQMLNQKLKEYEGKTGKQRITEKDLASARIAIKKITDNINEDLDSLTID